MVLKLWMLLALHGFEIALRIELICEAVLQLNQGTVSRVLAARSAEDLDLCGLRCAREQSNNQHNVAGLLLSRAVRGRVRSPGD